MKVKKYTYIEDEVAHIDQLGYQPYVNAIASSIANDELKTPFTIGIYGEWGSGKSSLMNLIRDKIDKTPNQTIFTVWFTPWQYQNQSNLLIPLFLTLLEQAKASRSLRERFASINKKTGKILTVTAEALLDLIAKPLVDVQRIKEQGEKYEEEHDITKNMYFHDILFLNRLKTEFEKLVKYLVCDNGKLVIFIDDLDRCLPDKVIEMLESIKLFLSTKCCIFVIGMNYDIISLCIKNKYRDFGSGKNKFSDSDVDEYLEKIIQLPFRIPALQSKALEKFISSVETDNEICDLKDFFAKFLPKNPRKVKKVLNIFRLMIKLAKYGKTRTPNIVPELLAKIIVIRERWLHLYANIENNPDLLKTFESTHDNIPGTLKNRDDFIHLLKYGSEKFGKQSNLHHYFTLSETTTTLETPKEHTSQGEIAPPNSIPQLEKKQENIDVGNQKNPSDIKSN